MPLCLFGRSGFALSLLLAIAITRDLLFLLLLLFASIYLLRRLTGNWQQWRVMRWVLPWLLLPIIALHIIFDSTATHDWKQFLQSLPHILYLILHLITLYAAGMLLSHSLHPEEWLALLARWSKMQRYVVLLPLLPLMRHDMRLRIALLCFAWRKQKKWRQRILVLPNLLRNLVVATIIHEQARAACLWLRWDGRLIILCWQINIVAWLAIFLGCILISMAIQLGR